MRTHFEARKLSLKQSPLVIHIARENSSGKLGRAVIREGSLTWYSSWAQKGRRITWGKLDELLRGEVPKRKRRKVSGI